MTTTTRRRATRKEEMPPCPRSLRHHWASETGFTVRDAPSPCSDCSASRWLSARISNELAVRGARALTVAGWTTARKMVDSTWADRARTLNESGYARFDERTAACRGLEPPAPRPVKGTAKASEEAGREQPPSGLLKEFKGSATWRRHLFSRGQGVWASSALCGRAGAQGRQRLGLAHNPCNRLARRRRGLPRLVAAWCESTSSTPTTTCSSLKLSPSPEPSEFG